MNRILYGKYQNSNFVKHNIAGQKNTLITPHEYICKNLGSQMFYPCKHRRRNKYYKYYCTHNYYNICHRPVTMLQSIKVS